MLTVATSYASNTDQSEDLALAEKNNLLITILITYFASVRSLT